jgi:hypothetical protein
LKEKRGQIIGSIGFENQSKEVGEKGRFGDLVIEKDC